MVQRATGKIVELHARRGDPRHPRHIIEGQDRVGIGDVQRVTNEHDSIGRVEMVDKYRPELGLAVAISGAYQSNAIAALFGGPGPRFYASGDKVLGPIGLGTRAITLDDQDIAVGQSIKGARMLEPCRQRLDFEAWGPRWRLARLPADRVRNAHGWHQIRVRLGQVRVRAVLPGRVRAL